MGLDDLLFVMDIQIEQEIFALTPVHLYYYPITISYGNGFSDLLDRNWCDGLNRIIPP